jgi:sigma-B regulation protein RsbU (phosphoserine phosphatase)
VNTKSPGWRDDGDDLFENAPCGYLVAGADRRIRRANATLASWVGQKADDLAGRRFTDLLSVGSRIHFETHFAPLLQMRQALSGVAVDLITADGDRLPVFIAINVRSGTDGKSAEFRMTIDDARDRRSYERELLDMQQRAEEQRQRVEVLARTLQRSLLPPSLSPPAGLEACALFRAASVDDVGGDFYDLFPLSADRWGFFLGDVCGKGAGAAAVTSLTRYTLRAAAVFDDDPVAVLHNLNAVLAQDFSKLTSIGDRPLFSTVIFGVLARSDGGFDVELAAGGHPCPLLLHGHGSAQEVELHGGQAVGMVADARFVATRLHLGPGDTLVLYTDGLTEARVGEGAERFDDSGALMRFAQALAPSTPEGICQAVDSLLDDFGAGLEDDVALLALGVPRPYIAE